MAIKKLILLTTFIAILAVAIAGCGKSDGKVRESEKSASGGDDKEIVINVGTTGTEGTAAVVGLEKFKEEVEKQSNGKIQVKLHINGALGGEREVLEAVTLGTIEATATSTAVVGNFVPEMGVADLPFVFQDIQHARKVMNGEVGEQIAKKLEAHNLKLLTWGESGVRNLTTSSKEVKTPGDLKGIKIRTMENKIHIEAWKALGAEATPMSWTEVYTALQQGVIDAQENPVDVIATGGIDQVQKYLILTGHVYNPYAYNMNLDFWNKLSKENQQIILDAAKKAQQANYEAKDKDEQMYIEQLKGKGMTVVEVDKQPFMEATQPIRDKYKDKFGDLLDLIAQTK